MAKELHSVITIDNEDYSITAAKVAQGLTIKLDGTETTFDGSESKSIDINKSKIGLTNVTNDAQVKRSEMGIASGVATLGTDGKVPTAQLPLMGVAYLGTVSASTGLSTTARAGDFYRVTTAFVFGSETAHVGDILISTKNNPAQNTTDWDILHVESIASFSKVEVNNQGTKTALSADSATGTLALVAGANITLTPNINNDSIIIAATGGGDGGDSNLISHGTDDPSASITSQYYFKY